MRHTTIWLLALALLAACLGGALAEDTDEEWEAYAARRKTLYTLEGDTLILHEGVTALGSYFGEYVDDPEDPDEYDIKEDPEVKAQFESAVSFDRWWDEIDFSRVQFPSTLQYLGSEAFNGYSFEEFTLPKGLKHLYRYVFNGCNFKTLRIEAEIPWQEIRYGMDYCNIEAYDVPEDHPLYKAVDGVLYSRDGKTLLSYPNARKDQHFDVPQGVERIGRGAMCNENLSTVSLPIGLTTLENYAFSGCTRLLSIALPLTVTEIGNDVFSDCVSLERVSLPEGLTANRQEDENWVVYYADDGLFRGDNGDTQGGQNQKGSWMNLGDPAILSGGGQEAPLYLYEKSDAGAPKESLPEGMMVYLHHGENGRLLVSSPLRQSQYLGWVPIEYVTLLPGESLFHYLSIREPAEKEIWWNHIPLPGEETPGERAAFFQDMPHLDFAVYGPFVLIGNYWNFYGDETVAVCRIQDVLLTRYADGTDRTCGVVYSESPYAPIPLRDGPEGEVLLSLMGGTQIEILAQDEKGYTVSTGLDQGWVDRNNVKIIPEATNEGED